MNDKISKIYLVYGKGTIHIEDRPDITHLGQAAHFVIYPDGFKIDDLTSKLFFQSNLLRVDTFSLVDLKKSLVCDVFLEEEAVYRIERGREYDKTRP